MKMKAGSAIPLAVLFAATVSAAMSVAAGCSSGAARLLADQDDDDRAVSERVADAAVTARVRAAFLFEPGLGSSLIDVKTSRGVVTLRGSVKTASQKDLAGMIAGRSDGVSELRNHLRVGNRRRLDPQEVDRILGDRRVDRAAYSRL